jgi:hypothetical protein
MDGTMLNDEFGKNLAAAVAERALQAIYKDKECPMWAAAMEGENQKEGHMSNKEQFLAFVCAGALAQDFSRKTNETALIMHIASRIPEEHIPDNSMNAAKVFLAYCDGLSKLPHHWMLARK